MVEEGVSPANPSIVPDPTEGYDRAYLLPSCRVAPDRVFLCRKVYESRQKRLLKNPLWKKSCVSEQTLLLFWSWEREKSHRKKLAILNDVLSILKHYLETDLFKFILVAKLRTWTDSSFVILEIKLQQIRRQIFGYFEIIMIWILQVHY